MRGLSEFNSEEFAEGVCKECGGKKRVPSFLSFFFYLEIKTENIPHDSKGFTRYFFYHQSHFFLFIESTVKKGEPSCIENTMRKSIEVRCAVFSHEYTRYTFHTLKMRKVTFTRSMQLFSLQKKAAFPFTAKHF